KPRNILDRGTEGIGEGGAGEYEGVARGKARARPVGFFSFGLGIKTRSQCPGGSFWSFRWRERRSMPRRRAAWLMLLPHSASTRLRCSDASWLRLEAEAGAAVSALAEPGFWRARSMWSPSAGFVR